MGPSAASQQIQQNEVTIEKSSSVMAKMLDVEAMGKRLHGDKFKPQRNTNVMTTMGAWVEVEFVSDSPKTLRDYLNLLKK